MAKIYTLGSQAESMIVSAVNKGKNFNRAAQSFFETANRTEQQGTALTAYYSSLNKIQEEVMNTKNEKTLVGKIKRFVDSNPNIKSTIEKSLKHVIKDDNKTHLELSKFILALEEKYPKTLQDRIAIADHGAVRFDSVHKPTWFEKLKISLSKLLRDED